MKIRIITFGCSNNLAESEIMAGLLHNAGYTIVEENEDLRIVNVCSVKGPSLNKGIKAIKKSEVPVVATGCIPKSSISKLKNLNKQINLVNTHNFYRILEVVECTLKGQSKDYLDYQKQERICMPKFRKNPIINIVPISSGCKGNCTYCSVKPIKGNLFSFPLENILEEIKNSLKNGCKEIWITGQDTGCYGLDLGLTLPELLKKILKIKGDFKVRLGMANPVFICRYADEMTEIFNNKKMFKFLHLPVQSGSNKILWLMKRAYTSEQYVKLIEKIKAKHPDLTIATDIIVGFPTETEEDFLESINIIKKTKPDVLNLSKYWIRPETEAASFDQIEGSIKKERISRIKKNFEEIALKQNEKWIGWEGEIIIDKKGKNDTMIGRNYAYKPVIAKGEYNLGKKLKIKIEKATKHDLRAQDLINV
ncbi:MAG: tRNA (N(6)-L-threonylcarbamoyladenosine(37)-C(2))-methylthiotransferase [Nanoarchaeota archaeon]|nr:tRNA (N(6)-L-threonylcarbamoyladenosine(37)-C(2))-methylthiotransferase [Nanoarchaeota archaeon]